ALTRTESPRLQDHLPPSSHQTASMQRGQNPMALARASSTAPSQRRTRSPAMTSAGPNAYRIPVEEQSNRRLELSPMFGSSPPTLALSYHSAAAPQRAQSVTPM